MDDWNFTLHNQTSHFFNGSNGSFTTNNHTDYDDGVISWIDSNIDVLIRPVISSFGIVGNILSFVVLLQLSKSSSFYLYLASLALSDTASLAFGLVFRSAINWTTSTYINGIIDCVTFIGMLTFSQLSSWTVVAVTVDRYVAVCHPLYVKPYCTRMRAMLHMGVTFLLLVAVNVTGMIATENPSRVLLHLEEDYNRYHIYIDLTAYALIPFVLICIFNILIIRTIIISASIRHNLSSVDTIRSSFKPNNNGSTVRTVTVLCAVTGCFIFCCFAFVVILLYQVIGNESNSSVYALAEMFLFLNHSVNFVLYGISGQRFREKFYEIFCLRCCLCNKLFACK